MTPLLVARLVRNGLWFLMAVSMFAGLSACAHPPHPAQEPVAARSEPPSADLTLWQAGLEKFRAGDYDDALIDFEVLNASARSERYGRMAEYASACMRLILAQSADDFREAMRLWAAWSEGEAAGNAEDPRLLRPLLERIALLRHPVSSDAESEKQAKPRQRPQYKLEWVNRDLAAYKSMAQAKEKEAERLKTRLESKEREVRRLKQQIESLEAIHLKFQERQKEVSSP
jgi:hypothetical protein